MGSLSLSASSSAVSSSVGWPFAWAFSSPFRLRLGSRRESLGQERPAGFCRSINGLACHALIVGSGSPSAFLELHTVRRSWLNLPTLTSVWFELLAVLRTQLGHSWKPFRLQHRHHLPKPLHRQLENPRSTIALILLKAQDGEIRANAALGIRENGLAAIRVEQAILANHLDKPTAVAFHMRIELNVVRLFEAPAVTMLFAPWTKIHTAGKAALAEVGLVLAGGAGA